MIALLQRVDSADVKVDGEQIASIGRGLLVLLGIEKQDSEQLIDRMVDRLIGYRVFEDEAGKMNLSLLDIKGELLIVPQFTLAADTRKGMRPSFSSAASPDTGRNLFEQFLAIIRNKYTQVQAGRFGADMKVSLVNNGPVTFWLQVN